MSRKALTPSRRPLLVLLRLARRLSAAQGTVTGSLQGIVKDLGRRRPSGRHRHGSSDALVRAKTTTVTDAAASTASRRSRRELRHRGDALGLQDGRAETACGSSLGQALASTSPCPLAPVTAEVIVTAEAPLVSVVSNTSRRTSARTTSTSSRVPRNYYQIIKTAPGVNADTASSSGSAILAYGGTTESQNAFTLDGVNVADAGSGQHWLLPSIQWMEEIQVAGLGANAEFGGYTGGDHQRRHEVGRQRVPRRPRGLLPARVVGLQQQPDRDPGRRSSSRTTLSASAGRSSKDKLWFFGSAEYWHQVTTPVGAVDTSDRKIPRFLGKLTFQPNETNRIFVMGEYDAVTNERRGISALTLPSGSQKQDGPGVTFAVNWESLLNSSNFVNVKVTGYDGNDDYLPYSGTDVPGPQRLLLRGHRVHVVQRRHLRSSPPAHRDGGRLVEPLRRRALRQERLALVQVRRPLREGLRPIDDWRRNGGFTYYDDSSLCASHRRATSRTRRAARYERSRGYGEYERPRPAEGLHLLRAGLHPPRPRHDQRRPAVHRLPGRLAGRASATRASTSVDFVDPRIGFVWDVSGDAKWALKAHWGRYHSSMYTYLLRPRGLRPRRDPGLGQRVGPGDPDLGRLERHTAGRGRRWGTSTTPTSTRRSSRSSTSSARTWPSGFDFIDRRFRRHHGAGQHQQRLLAGHRHPEPAHRGDRSRSGPSTRDPVFVLTTDNPGYRTYDSLVLRFDKRYADGWQLRSSLVWTDLKGNVLKNNGYADELQDRNGLVNADGKMDSPSTSGSSSSPAPSTFPSGSSRAASTPTSPGSTGRRTATSARTSTTTTAPGRYIFLDGTRLGEAPRPQHPRPASRVGDEDRRNAPRSSSPSSASTS